MRWCWRYLSLCLPLGRETSRSPRPLPRSPSPPLQIGAAGHRPSLAPPPPGAPHARAPVPEKGEGTGCAGTPPDTRAPSRTTLGQPRRKAPKEAASRPHAQRQETGSGWGATWPMCPQETCQPSSMAQLPWGGRRKLFSHQRAPLHVPHYMVYYGPGHARAGPDGSRSRWHVYEALVSSSCYRSGDAPKGEKPPSL